MVLVFLAITRNNMKKNSYLLVTLLAGSIFLSSLVLVGCSSNIFDSSVGPDGKTALADNNAKKVTKQKPKAKKNTTVKRNQTPLVNEKKKSEQIAQAFETELKAGVVKPYVPDASQEAGNILPTIDALKGKEIDSPLAKVSVQDVVNGNVDLNNVVNNQQPSQIDTNQTALPQAFEPVDTPQNLSPLQSSDQNANSIEEQTVEVINSSNEQNVSDLGVDAKCGTANASHVAEVAYNTAAKQANRLANEVGPIYIAPTVIPDSLSDCIKDVSPAIKQALSQSNIQTVVGSGVNVQQNSGSSTVIPALIRACKRTGIPLLNVSVVRHIGTNTVITIRNIRVKDGITLVQNTTPL